MRFSRNFLYALLSLVIDCSAANQCIADELRIPAFTAYMLPNPENARFSEQKGVTRWNDPSQSINWYGKFETTGELKVKAEIFLAEGVQSRFKFTVGGVRNEARETTVTGQGADKPVTADFGVFMIATPGHQRLQLESMNEAKAPIAEIKALLLDGAALEKAHFNLKERYGNQWIRTPDNKWIELVTAKFSHDPTGKTDRFDRFMGVENGEFFLSHGGFVDGFSKYGEMFKRPTAGQPPSDLILPE